MTTFKLSLDLTSNWETRVALIYYLIFHGIKLSNVMLSGIFKNIDFHRLYRGTVFQKKVFEDQRGNVWQHAMDVKTNPTISNSCFQALTRNKKNTITSSILYPTLYWLQKAPRRLFYFFMFSSSGRGMYFKIFSIH